MHKMIRNFRIKLMKKKLKSIAVNYVQNDKFIKRAVELKDENRTLRKQFSDLKLEINQLEGSEGASEDDSPNEPSLDLCFA